MLAWRRKDELTHQNCSLTADEYAVVVLWLDSACDVPTIEPAGEKNVQVPGRPYTATSVNSVLRRLAAMYPWSRSGEAGRGLSGDGKRPGLQV